MKITYGISLYDYFEIPAGVLVAILRENRVEALEFFHGMFAQGDILETLELFRQLVFSGSVVRTSWHMPFCCGYDLSTVPENYWNQERLNFASQLGLARLLNAGIAVFHSSLEPILNYERTRKIGNVIANCEALAPVLKANRVRGALELLPRSCIGNTVEELQYIIERLDPEVYGVCLDLNHCMDRYRELPDAIRALGGRLLELHVSDYDGVDEKHWVPGEGVNDWPAIMAALKEIDYDGQFVYETRSKGGTVRDRIGKLTENYHWLSTLSK